MSNPTESTSAISETAIGDIINDALSCRLSDEPTLDPLGMWVELSNGSAARVEAVIDGHLAVRRLNGHGLMNQAKPELSDTLILLPMAGVELHRTALGAQGKATAKRTDASAEILAAELLAGGDVAGAAAIVCDLFGTNQPVKAKRLLGQLIPKLIYMGAASVLQPDEAA